MNDVRSLMKLSKIYILHVRIDRAGFGEFKGFALSFEFASRAQTTQRSERIIERVAIKKAIARCDFYVK